MIFVETTLRELAALLPFAADLKTNPDRVAIAGIYVDLNRKKLVALDGHILCIANKQPTITDYNNEPYSFGGILIPTEHLKHFLKVAKADKVRPLDTVTITLDPQSNVLTLQAADKQAQIYREHGMVTPCSRSYPDYAKLWRRETDTPIVVVEQAFFNLEFFGKINKAAEAYYQGKDKNVAAGAAGVRLCDWNKAVIQTCFGQFFLMGMDKPKTDSVYRFGNIIKLD